MSTENPGIGCTGCTEDRAASPATPTRATGPVTGPGTSPVTSPVTSQGAGPAAGPTAGPAAGPAAGAAAGPTAGPAAGAVEAAATRPVRATGTAATTGSTTSSPTPRTTAATAPTPATPPLTGPAGSSVPSGSSARAAAPAPPSSSPAFALPLLPAPGAPAPERADAARNRRRILDATARIVAEEGPAAVTMNQVAHASGIGVGTVYRRFGDVTQLLWALLDDRERRFQEAYMSGPPPLGPGAPADERLDAFLDALVDRIGEQREILLAAHSASPRARHHSGAYQVMHTHVSLLVARLRPGADSALLADLLLAPFAPDVMHHLAVERELSADRLKAGVRELLRLRA
ncbi:TetR/AcrR family transcriptional regulator [Streptomyces sp. NPDC059247]|uniref:TetR/AcrR family transcriptional regulator n=1 Tax=Streptomyces sp. NPDC059247 TaxID=3346790 RepID=UPI0036A6A14B